MAAQQYVGTIERTLTTNGAFRVFLFQVEGNDPDSKRPMRCVNVGPIPDCDWLIITGRWQRHRAYGWQFKVFRCSPTMPRTTEGIRQYLRTGAVAGVGHELVERLIAAFGRQTLRVMEAEPARLTAVHGIGPQKAEAIAQHVRSARKTQQSIGSLTDLGIDHDTAAALYLRYGDSAYERLTDDPFEALGGYPFFQFDIAATFPFSSDSLVTRAVALGASAVHHAMTKSNCLTVTEADLSEYLARTQYPAEKVSELVAHTLSTLKQIPSDKAKTPSQHRYTTLWVYERVLQIAEHISLKDQDRPHPVTMVNQVLEPYAPEASDARLFTVVDIPETVNIEQFVSALLCQCKRRIAGFIAETVLPSRAALVEYRDFRYWPTVCRESTRYKSQMPDLLILANAHEYSTQTLANLIQRAAEGQVPTLILGNTRYSDPIGTAVFRDLCRASDYLASKIDLGNPIYEPDHHPIHSDITTHCLGSPTFEASNIDLKALSGSPVIRIPASTTDDQYHAVTHVISRLSAAHTTAAFAIVTEYDHGILSPPELNPVIASLCNPRSATTSNDALISGDVVHIARPSGKHHLLRTGIIASVITVSNTEDTCDLSVRGHIVRNVPIADLTPITLGYVTPITHTQRPRRLYVILLTSPDTDIPKHRNAYQRLLRSVGEHLVVIGDVNDPEPRFGGTRDEGDAASVIRACLPDHT